MSKYNKADNIQKKFLSKTQEVHDQKDFKRANRVYHSVIGEKNRS